MLLTVSSSHQILANPNSTSSPEFAFPGRQALLLVEDEPLLRRRLASQLEQLGFEVTVADSVASARRSLRSIDFDCALLDVNLPDGRSIELLELKAIPENVITIMMTADGGISGAVEAIRRGADDYISKPVDPNELILRFASSRRQRGSKRRNQLQSEVAAHDVGGFFFGESLAMVARQLDRIVVADRQIKGALPPILITGETGTGKTSLARWIHHRGPRCDRPLIEINCSALPEALADSELFGHERGAFTDAKESRIGLLEAAEDGTVFLDELSSLSLSTQAKLLKTIEDRTIRRVGGSRSIPMGARVIAASNCDLQALVVKGTFREDLMHRLDLFRVVIPPLRERGQDLVILARALSQKIASKYGVVAPEIPPLGLQRLLAHRWSGNVRELCHEIERSLVFDDDKLTFGSLAMSIKAREIPNSFSFTGADCPIPVIGFSLENAINNAVRKALLQCDGNVSAAARILGVTRDFVRYRQSQFGENG